MLANLDQRGYIKTCAALNQSPISIHNNLVLVYGDNAYSYKTVTLWVNSFRAGNTNINDKPRTGRPITAKTDTNIALVEKLIDEHPRISYSYLEELTSISRGTLETIIKQELQMRKRSSRWIPHKLTPENKQKRLDFAKAMLEKLNSEQWRLDQILTGDECIFYHRKIEKRQATATWKRKGEPPECIVKRDRYEAKTMICIFFRSSGPVLVHAVTKGTTIDHQYYIENCLGPAFNELEKQRPKSGLHGIKLLHDGAKPHVHSNTSNFIESNGIIEINHPPYSPDLAPCDFWLFDHIKKQLEDYTSSKALLKGITKVLENIPKKEYLKTFKKYVERLEFCIEAEGDYFEHMIK
jgi:histone-lysine N-methyltransferase SETMAR